MSHTYTWNSANNTTGATLPSDGDGPGIKASDVNPGIQAAGDKAAAVEDLVTTETSDRIADVDAEEARALAAEAALEPGRLLAVTKLDTIGSANFTTGANTKKCRVWGVGPGGGGGGVSNAAGAGVAGGGGSGAYVEKTFACDPSTAYAYTVTDGGAGNSAAGGTAGVGATFDCNGTTITAGGGAGAPGGVPQATRTVQQGAAGGNASSNGDINGTSGAGAPGIAVETSGTQYGIGGDGANSPYGNGGRGATANGNGGNASGYGAGGGGAISNNTTNRAGGKGSQSFWVVEEYS